MGRRAGDAHLLPAREGRQVRAVRLGVVAPRHVVAVQRARARRQRGARRARRARRHRRGAGGRPPREQLRNRVEDARWLARRLGRTGGRRRCRCRRWRLAAPVEASAAPRVEARLDVAGGRWLLRHRVREGAAEDARVLAGDRDRAARRELQRHGAAQVAHRRVAPGDHHELLARPDVVPDAAAPRQTGVVRQRHRRAVVLAEVARAHAVRELEHHAVHDPPLAAAHACERGRAGREADHREVRRRDAGSRERGGRRQHLAAEAAETCRVGFGATKGDGRALADGGDRVVGADGELGAVALGEAAQQEGVGHICV